MDHFQPLVQPPDYHPVECMSAFGMRWDGRMTGMDRLAFGQLMGRKRLVRFRGQMLGKRTLAQDLSQTAANAPVVVMSRIEIKATTRLSGTSPISLGEIDMMPMLRRIGLVVSATVYWFVAAPSALIIGLQIEEKCDLEVAYLASCGLSDFSVPILFAVFMTLYTSIVWVLARRIERTEAEANRLAEDAAVASDR